MKKINYILSFIVISILGFVSCDTYPKYEKDFSATYPLNGEYYVKLYKTNSSTPVSSGYFKLYLYNASNDGKDSVWVDCNLKNNSTSIVKFKVKAPANVEGRSFDSGVLRNNKDVTVSFQSSKVELKDLPNHDSIYFTVNFKNSATGLDSTFVVGGHRRTGFEQGTGYGDGL